MKISPESIKASYSATNTVEYYTRAVWKIGLWESEKSILEKYLDSKEDSILDLGSGAGRVSVSLYRMGYKNIRGIDLSPPMIRNARIIAKKLNLAIPFDEGNALDLQFTNESFHLVIFSFNGLMLIPGLANRIKAIQEIKRILKPKGYFVFSTHDRDKQANLINWDKNHQHEQNPMLHDFGDRIIKGKAEYTYLHFPDRQEIIQSLLKGGLDLIEDFWRSDLYDESPIVKSFSTDCRFWIAQKSD